MKIDFIWVLSRLDDQQIGTLFTFNQCSSLASCGPALCTGFSRSSFFFLKIARGNHEEASKLKVEVPLFKKLQLLEKRHSWFPRKTTYDSKANRKMFLPAVRLRIGLAMTSLKTERQTRDILEINCKYRGRRSAQYRKPHNLPDIRERIDLATVAVGSGTAEA